MARPGITYHMVANAAEQLLGQGKNPTIENIRLLTGTGSTTTIANHLRMWKSNQNTTRALSQQENLPEEMVALMKGLWERLLNQADERVIFIQQDFEQTAQQLHEQIEKLHTENKKAEQDIARLKQEREELCGDKAGLESTVKALQEERIALTTTLEANQHQLQEKQHRIEELTRLHHQVQANLEHYRESAREQRLLDQERYQQLQNELTHTISTLKQELALKNQQQASLQSAYEKLQEAHTLLQQQQEGLRLNYEVASTTQRELEHEVTKYCEAKEHWQAQYQTLHEKADKQHQSLMSLETQAALLSQQLAAAQAEAKQLQEKNHYLTQEKWELGQEKAQLVGQLKQLQNMVS